LPAVRSAQGAERGWLDIVLASDGEPDKHAEFVRRKDLTKFPYVMSEHLGRSFGVAKLPYAVLIDEAGKLSATGLVNTREHLESLFVAKESGVGSIQQFLSQVDRGVPLRENSVAQFDRLAEKCCAAFASRTSRRSLFTVLGGFLAGRRGAALLAGGAGRGGGRELEPE
jgi:hypothetical protein